MTPGMDPENVMTRDRGSSGSEHPKLSRRRLLQLSGQGCLGLSLAGLLRAQAAQAVRPPERPVPARIKSCILVFYYGGPSHLDTFDMKPDAPVEVRGEFKPIATTASGVRVCEHLPRLARLMHKVAVIRTMHHANHLHDSAAIETLTGRPIGGPDRELFAPTPQFFPSYGSVLSYVIRDQRLDVAYAILPFLFHNVVDVPCQGAGFLGAAHDPFLISVDSDAKAYRAETLTLADNLPPARLGGRRELLDALGSGVSAGAAPEMHGFYDRAFQLLGSDAVRRALDVTREEPRTRERYGFGSGPVAVGEGGGGGNGAEMGAARNMRGQNLLLARRLVEAGVPFVHVNDFKQQGQNWDAHFKVFNQHRTHLLPGADQSLSALLEDLDTRGLLDTTLVVVTGEFGRTPRINKDGGRDHWPECYSVLLAGGGVNGGSVFGASDKIGAYPDTDPVTPADLAATIFWRFGIDPATEIHDLGGRPYKLTEGQPLRKLFQGG
jgi:hypothetical protein